MSRQDCMIEVAQGYIDRKQFNSVEWRVEARGNELSSGQAGSIAGETGTPIYRIYSMTKPIVSLMALILIEQGKLRLYDMLPQFNPAFRNMQVLYPDGRLQPG